MTQMQKMPQGCFLPASSLDTLLPMHAIACPEGVLRHVAPTLARVAPFDELVGQSFFESFEIERPRLSDDSRTLEHLIGRRIRLRFKADDAHRMKASVLPLGEGQGFIIDLSFGISVMSAVAEFGLTGADFAQNDPTVEMLYLVEANAAVMAESERLIERLQSAKDTAEEASLSDGLTGLRNRRALELEAEARLRSNASFSLFHVDLDFFKAVNDTLGHAAGDAVLVETAARLKAAVRQADFVARVGGDEFVFLIAQQLDAEDLLALAERIIAALETPVPFGDDLCKISASIGIVRSELYDAPSLDLMMRDADHGLYEAKESGRGRAVLVAAGSAGNA